MGSILNSDYYNSFQGEIDIILSVLESGRSVELSASGYSMFPTLRPGDRVMVKPLLNGELPVKGSVVVYIDNGITAQRFASRSWIAMAGNNGATEARRKATGDRQQDPGGSEHRAQGTESSGQNLPGFESGLVMHRLIEIIPDNPGGQLFITRGDSRPGNDRTWSKQNLLGIAVSYKRGKKEYTLNTFIPGPWRNRFNARLLWTYGILKRILKKVSGVRRRVSG